MYLWTKDLSVGIDELDLQHQKFIDRINSFEQFSRVGKAQYKVGEMLDFLMEYAKKHFLDEEQYMAKHSYPDLEAHAREHVYFVNRLVEFRVDFEEQGGTPEMASDIAGFTGKWLFNHIITQDQKYKRFVKQVGRQT